MILHAFVGLILFPTTGLGQTSQDRDSLSTLLQLPIRRQVGDLDEIRKRGVLRVLVTFNRTNFFIGEKRPRGFEYELLTEYEKHLNATSQRGRPPTRVVFIPVSRDQLLPFLIEGKGDVAAAGLTVTRDRLRQVVFTDPYLDKVDEILVVGRDISGLKSLHDLAGQQVFVRNESSYAEHLRNLSRKLESEGRPAIEVVQVADDLETEDILELVNAGVLGVTVADRHLAELWSQVLDNIVIRPDLAVNRGGRIAWAVRPNNPQLLASLNGFVRKSRKGTLLGNIFFLRYYRTLKWIRNPLPSLYHNERARFLPLFRDYGKRYDIDWRALAALAYQESGLDPALKSAAGAIGLMQVKPETAASIGINDIEDPENNIHAGAKYLDWLRTRFFNDPLIPPPSKIAFLVAAYNAGPNRVVRLRRKAAEQGYDPNRWFGNVELAALREIGRETVRYVANVNKYYVAIRLYDELLARRAVEIESLRRQ